MLRQGRGLPASPERNDHSHTGRTYPFASARLGAPFWPSVAAPSPSVAGSCCDSCRRLLKGPVGRRPQPTRRPSTLSRRRGAHAAGPPLWLSSPRVTFKDAVLPAQGLERPRHRPVLREEHFDLHGIRARAARDTQDARLRVGEDLAVRRRHLCAPRAAGSQATGPYASSGA